MMGKFFNPVGPINRKGYLLFPAELGGGDLYVLRAGLCFYPLSKSSWRDSSLLILVDLRPHRIIQSTTPSH